MFKKLINIALIFSVAASVTAGMPFHFGDGEHAMMDCCKAALEQDGSPRTAIARICCAMNCNEPASTNGSTSQSISQVGAQPSPTLVYELPSAVTNRSQRLDSSLPPGGSRKAAYLLNLALLI